MTHTDRKGRSKILPSCTLPLTATAQVDMIITDLAVFTFVDGTLVLEELMPGVSLDEVRRTTEATFVSHLEAS